ncbi:MAG: hypothetical protein CVU44_11380 [Chloroflexi bacterium HGW-Chloroflexi-6]|nr:MAG: hypothetical protein CVU44_11380 [Chloroflexi bacterium HGW-Chloroflexi-6]
METYNFPDHLRGDTFDAIIFEVLVNSVALNLTGATVRIDLRKNGELYYRLKNNPGTGEGSITVTDAAAGKFRVDEQIIDIPGNVYSHDIEITLASGRKKTYAGGSWTIREDVTHDR